MSKDVVKYTEKQEKFLDALRSEEVIYVPPGERFRWCATRAGYSETTPLSQIMSPLSKDITDVAEKILADASINAALTLRDAVSGGVVDLYTKTRLDAAKDILDRSVPKKEAKSQILIPTIQIMLPAKEVKMLEHVKDD